MRDAVRLFLSACVSTKEDRDMRKSGSAKGERDTERGLTLVVAPNGGLSDHRLLSHQSSLLRRGSQLLGPGTLETQRGRERHGACACVCVCRRERMKTGEEARESVCVCLCVCMCIGRGNYHTSHSSPQCRRVVDRQWRPAVLVGCVPFLSFCTYTSSSLYCPSICRTAMLTCSAATNPI